MDNLSSETFANSLMEQAERLLRIRIDNCTPAEFAAHYLDTHVSAYASTPPADMVMLAGFIQDRLRNPAVPFHAIPGNWPAELAWPPTLTGYFYVGANDKDLYRRVGDIDTNNWHGATPIGCIYERLLCMTGLQLERRTPNRPNLLPWRDRDGGYDATPFGLDRKAYENVTFRGERWFNNMIRDRPWLSSVAATPEKPDMIRFYATNADAQRGRYSEAKVGRFLTRFKDWPEGDGIYITEDRIRDTAANQHKALSTDYGDTSKWAFLMADDADSFEFVYTNGPHSCMCHPRDHFWSRRREHPVRVYASGDFVIAWLASVEDPTLIIARTLVHKGNLAYGRLYPTPSEWQQNTPRLYLSGLQAQAASDALGRHLEEHGYSQDDGTDFEDARLRRIELGNGEFIAPYLDNSYVVRDDGDWLVMGRTGGWDDSAWGSPGTGGIVQLRATVECEHCGDDYDEEDGQTVVTATNRNGTRAYSEERWCQHCYENSTFYCDGLGETLDQDLHGGEITRLRRTTVAATRSSNWRTLDVNENFRDTFAFYCDRNDAYFDSTEFTSIEVGSDTWCLEASLPDLFWCRYNEAFYHVDDEHPDHPGFHEDTTPRERAIARQREVATHGAGAPMILAA